MLAKGIDPLAAKEAATAATAAPEVPPFGQCADMLFDTRRAAWSETHAQQWQNSIKTYCAPILAMPIDQVDRQAVLACLQAIWLVKSETAQRLRARIEDILDFANAHHWRSNDNPARFKALCVAPTAEARKTAFPGVGLSAPAGIRGALAHYGYRHLVSAGILDPNGNGVI